MGILDTFSLAGCIAMVTGGGRGIGRSLAGALADAGADVVIVDIDPVTASSAADQIRNVGVRSFGLEADLTIPTQIRSTLDAVVSNWGRLDIAVNNAGIASTARAEAIEEADWDRILDVNLKSVFLCCQAEAQVMLGQRSGSIINIASMSAHIVNRPQQHAHYNISKAAVVQLTRTCAAEWAARGVRVNSISPGHMLTPMTDAMSDKTKATWISNTPMGRIGMPDDLQGAVVFLASAASEYVTGHDLVVDGGYTIW